MDPSQRLVVPPNLPHVTEEGHYDFKSMLGIGQFETLHVKELQRLSRGIGFKPSVLPKKALAECLDLLVVGNFDRVQEIKNFWVEKFKQCKKQRAKKNGIGKPIKKPVTSNKVSRIVQFVQFSISEIIINSQFTDHFHRKSTACRTSQRSSLSAKMTRLKP